MQSLARKLKFSVKYICSNAVSLSRRSYLSHRRFNSQSPAVFKMKIDTPEYHALFTPELRMLVSMFQKHNYQLRLAGGAVRDLLMGATPHDLDFATNATPTQMREIFKAENVRIIDTNGESHGTLTVRINSKVNYEVTTLRVDILTDGRHAQVEFTNDWRLDASRRDLTVNALFIDMFDATVYDYFSGIEDIAARRVRFVGDAASRIQEDYLRILRYFRFYGRIAESSDAHDEEAISAIGAHASGLRRIAGERIWVELKRIVLQRFAPSIMRKMHQLRLFESIGLPVDSDLDEFERVFERAVVPAMSSSRAPRSRSPSPSGQEEQESSNSSTSVPSGEPRLQLPMPITMLTTLMRSEEDVLRMNARLRLSNEEVGTAGLIIRQRPVIRQMIESGASQDDLIRHLERLIAGRSDGFVETSGRGNKIPPTRREGRAVELCKYFGDAEIYCKLKDWRPQKFPVRGETLMARGVQQSRSFGLVMQRLRDRWIASRFQLTEEQLLVDLPNLLNEVEAELLSKAAATSNTVVKSNSPKRIKP